MIRKDLETTDRIAAEVLEAYRNEATDDISLQLSDNINWIRSAQENKLVVGSQARILRRCAGSHTHSAGIQ